MPFVTRKVSDYFYAEATPAVVLTSAGLVVFCAGVAIAIASPVRGIQDRLAGTWLVPR